MVQKGQYHAFMAEVQKPAQNMDKCDLSTGSHKKFSQAPSSKMGVNLHRLTLSAMGWHI
jgi:hypothetical protein